MPNYLGHLTELEGPAIDSPVGSQQLAAPLGGGELESRVLGNPPSSWRSSPACTGRCGGYTLSGGATSRALAAAP